MNDRNILSFFLFSAPLTGVVVVATVAVGRPDEVVADVAALEVTREVISLG